MSRRQTIVWFLLWPLGACFVVFGELGFWLNGFAPRETFVLDLAVSSVSIVSGLILWRLRPGNRTGPLLALVGFVWTIGGIRAYGNPWAFGVGEWFDGAQDLVLAHLLIAYPTGRLRTRPLRILVGSGYALMLLSLARTMTFHLPNGENAFAVWNAPGVHSTVETVASAAGALYALIGIGIVTRRFVVASPTARRVLGPVLAAALVYAVTVGADALVDALTGTEPDLVFFPPLIARLMIPLAFLYGLLQDQLGRGAVGSLVIELGTHGVETMQQALARTFRDDTLQVGYRIAGADEYVDAAGSPVELPAEGDRRVATAIEREGVPLAVIVHDRALLEQPGLVESATAAARLALDNERLQAELRTQLDALRRSRARLVQTSDAERRRLERNLHDGAQQRLLGVGLALQLLRNRVGAGEAAHLLAEAELELQHALDELRELARGLHPAILADQGLASAARTLAGRAPIPVTVTERGERLPAAVETAGYFVVAEALANVAKYAQAERAWVTIERQNGSARIEIVDDGVGGADPAGGSGLTGLVDRVGALDGRLLIESPHGQGTRISAEIPCG